LGAIVSSGDGVELSPDAVATADGKAGAGDPDEIGVCNGMEHGLGDKGVLLIGDDEGLDISDPDVLGLGDGKGLGDSDIKLGCKLASCVGVELGAIVSPGDGVELSPDAVATADGKAGAGDPNKLGVCNGMGHGLGDKGVLLIGDDEGLEISDPDVLGVGSEEHGLGNADAGISDGKGFELGDQVLLGKGRGLGCTR